MNPDLGIRKADSTKIQSLIGGEDDDTSYYGPGMNHYGMGMGNPMMGMGGP